MNTLLLKRFLLFTATCLPVAEVVQAGQEKPSQAPAAQVPKEAAPEAAPTREALEETFRRTMTGATLRGHWRMTGADGLEGKAPLGDEREEDYQIVDVTKVKGDRWIVRARIRFADKDVTIPVPVDVLWAGDTPIITLDKLAMPLLGTYSARVMIYRNFYCGTWFGANYGGIMSGQILRTADIEAETATEPPAGSDAADDASGENANDAGRGAGSSG